MMIDAAPSVARLDQSKTDAMNAASFEARITASVECTPDAAISGYEDLCRTAAFAPSQSALWVSNWIAECRPDFLIATLYSDDLPILALPLEVVSAGPFRIAQFMGGRHANGNFPAADLERLPKDMTRPLALLLEAVSRLRPDIDVIALNRLLPELDGRPNPFLIFPNSSSPNVSLAVDLAGGFEALLERPNGVRKQKKHRWQARKLEASGPCRRIEAKTPKDVIALLEAFFAMKDARFRKMGIANVFAAPEVRSFFAKLFVDALSQPQPPFVLHGLEVGGILRAITGSSCCGTRLICEFGSITDDELAHASPGGFLFFDNIREACEQGFAIYDFSVGDEPYKRNWCDLEIQHREVLLSLTMKGRAFAFGLHQNARLTAYIKNNPAIWRLMKRVRRKAIGQSLPDSRDDG
jgi:CelD/BcsL family acetyltransferase involved in cellulose biosynthesis